MLNRIVLILALAPAVLWATATRGDERSLAQARAKAIEAFVGDELVAVVHVDLTRVNLDALHSQVVDPLLLATGTHPAQGPDKKMVQHVLDELLKAGAKEVYLIALGREMGVHPPFVLVTLSAGADEQALTELLNQSGAEAVSRIGDMLAAGSRDSLERLKNQKPAIRPELAQAFLAAGDTTYQFVLLPTEDDRKVIEQLLPSLPKEAGGGSTQPFARGLSWLALGVDGPPKMSLRLVLESPDAKSAEQLSAAIANVYRALKDEPHVSKAVPLDKLAALVKPEFKGNRITVSIGGENAAGGLIDVLKSPVAAAQKSAWENQSANNLKQIALAMHRYHDAHKGFPAAFSTSMDGKPLLSWRVHILPYVEGQKLYEQFHLDEPWDSEHNKPLVAMMPQIYACPGSASAAQNRTVYLTPRGEGTVFPGAKPIAIKDITDGTSNTILVVEADEEHAVEWTRPDDLPYDPKTPTAGLGGHFDNWFHAALCDGSVRFFDLKADADGFRARFSRAGGEVVPND